MQPKSEQPKSESYDSVIIGGGFFGLYIGDFLASRKQKVLVCESADECMTRASYNNQARVHSGYHYPRSLLTAMRSCVSFPRFVKEFPECICSDFNKYYAVGKILGKINARQFEFFCKRINAPCEPAPPKITALFSPQLIEAVFTTREYAFDAVKLREAILQRFLQSGGEVVTHCQVTRIESADRVQLEKGGVPLENGEKGDWCHSRHQTLAKRFSMETVKDGAAWNIAAHEVYNCTYSHLNFVNTHSGIDLIPLKHEMTEMALVEVPEEIQHLGITVMCGPFFSMMPFPAQKLHTLSHVRYTPHYEWHDRKAGDYRSAYLVNQYDEKKSRFESMKRDTARYFPIAENCQYKGSLWETKTVLPSSEADDSRPILFKPNYCLKGYHCIMGGKIDNVYDVVDAIKKQNGWE